MIELLPGFPDNVLAVRASGTVTKRDYDTVLIPAGEASLKKPGKLRVYYEIAPEFQGFSAGAMWDDFAFGIGHASRWERVAAVTDIAWMQHATHALAFLMPCPVRVYAIADKAEARAWIAA